MLIIKLSKEKTTAMLKELEQVSKKVFFIPGNVKYHFVQML